MLYKYQKDDDEEVNEEPIDDPDINELYCRCLRQFRSYRVVECVHDQHCSDRNRDTGLEMLLAKIQGCLKNTGIN